MSFEGNQNKRNHNEVRGTTKMRIMSKRSHLADLLSRKDVKEGFNRKPTTIAKRKTATM